MLLKQAGVSTQWYTLAASLHSCALQGLAWAQLDIQGLSFKKTISSHCLGQLSRHHIQGLVTHLPLLLLIDVLQHPAELIQSVLALLALHLSAHLLLPSHLLAHFLPAVHLVAKLLLAVHVFAHLLLAVHQLEHLLLPLHLISRLLWVVHLLGLLLVAQQVAVIHLARGVRQASPPQCRVPCAHSTQISPAHCILQGGSDCFDLQHKDLISTAHICMAIRHCSISLKAVAPCTTATSLILGEL